MVCVFQRLAESVLFFRCFCLTSHRLLPLLAESRVNFFSGLLCGACLWCDIPVLTIRLGEWKRKKKPLEKDRNAARQQSQELTATLFSSHCLRYAAMHTKYSEEWLKQTHGKQMWTQYSSWPSCFLLPSLYVICHPSASFAVLFIFLIRFNLVLYPFYSPLSTVRELITGRVGIDRVKYLDDTNALTGTGWFSSVIGPDQRPAGQPDLDWSYM